MHEVTRTDNQLRNSTSISEILQCDDDQRLNYIVHMFAKHHMAGRRYEAKSWHAHFRRIAANPIVFYQVNSAVFYEDSQYENENFPVANSTYIHGDLHVGQFRYYIDDLNSQQIFSVGKHKKMIGAFTTDLKRLGSNLALIAYNQCFSDIEIVEVLEAFTRQYIKSVLSYGEQSIKEEIMDNKLSYSNQSVTLSKQLSANELVQTQYERHIIDWQSFDCVKKLVILAEKLAATTAYLHNEMPCELARAKDMTTMNVSHGIQNIHRALSSIVQQKELIEEIRRFSMIYVEIAERDYHLFFRNFRNQTMFEDVANLKKTQISPLLADTHQVSVLVVGGGIGGLGTALSFARAGIHVTVLEKNNDFKEVGAGMQLAPNCSRLLDKLGILKQVQANAVFPKQIVWMDAISGERLTCIDLGKKFIETFGYPYIVVHRADLLNALYQACLESSMVTLEKNSMVISVDERPNSIMVDCANGTRYNCNMVVAADGLWSSLRRFVCDDGSPISLRYVTYRGTVGIEQVSKEAGLENVQFWIGPDMHLVQYPVRRGELFNQAAVFKSTRIPDDSDQWGTKEELNERFSIGCQHVQNALKLLQTNFRWPIYE